ncbi:MAG: thioesterase domain-containing protein, partial [Actinomycetota bacterium]
ALMDGATVRGLAAMVEAHASGDRPVSGLTVLQDGEAGRPVLYVTHDLLGSMFRYGPLIEALGADQPVVGFESPALSGEPFPFTRIETFALRYATEIRRAQPHGPYHLFGYSFGGILAFEIARHLRRAGEEVPLLAVLDIGPGYRGIDYSRVQMPDGPWLDLPEPPADDAPAHVRAAHLGRIARESPRTAARYLAFHSRHRRRLHDVTWRRELRRDGRIPADQRLWYAYETHWGLVGPSWSGAAYDGPLTLFWSDETGATDGTMGWGPLVGELDIHRVSAGHEQLLDPPAVGVVAEELRARLDAGRG